MAGYSALMGRLAGEFGFKAVAVSLRESLSASDNNWSALLYSGGEVYESKNTAYTSWTASAAGTPSPPA